jgi:hypothetical protein
MLKSKYWYAILPAALVLGMPFSSVARIGLNGTSLNGISLISMISPNGITINGTSLIALLSPNGIAINGTALQSLTVKNQGVLRAENGRLVIQTSPTAP